MLTETGIYEQNDFLINLIYSNMLESFTNLRGDSRWYSVIVIVMLFLMVGCGSQGNKKKQTYLDRNMSTYVQYSSGISQKIELHRDTHTYYTYDRFDVTNSSNWSVSCKGSYSEEPINESGVVIIYFDGAEHLGDYRSGKIYTDTDVLVASAPSNVFKGKYQAE